MASKKSTESCKPEGDCIPCTNDEVLVEFCKPGVKFVQPLKCTQLPDGAGKGPGNIYTTFGTCTNQSQQKSQFSQFLILNLAIAVLSSFVVIWRKRKMSIQHQTLLRELE